MFKMRTAGILGIVATFLCWGGMLLFGALRPSYSHSVNAVSELGALGTPNALPWNIIGFFIPGLLLAIAGGAAARSIHADRRRPTAFWLLILAGLGFAATGIFPAEVKDGIPIVTSPFTRGHFIASLVHGFAWLVAVTLLIRPMLANRHWRRLTVPSIGLAILTVAASIALRGTVSDAIVQRVAGGLYFLWIVMISIRLITLGSPRAPEPDRNPA
jgi:hypothetical membrane protein